MLKTHHLTSTSSTELRNYTTTPAGQTPRVLAEIRADVFRLGAGWPKRERDRLVVPRPGRDGVVALRSSRALFAWLLERCEIDWSGGRSMVTRGDLFESLRAHAAELNRVETAPHFPALPDHNYLHQAYARGNGAALRGLLAMFSPATPVDGELLKALVLTLVWGGPYGERPLFLIAGDGKPGDGGQGCGKSSLVDTLAHLVGGIIDAAPGDGMKQIKTRLLSPEGQKVRVVRLDNVRAAGFKWSELEAAVTASAISGRELYAGEGQRPNTVVWVATGNGVTLGRDMAQRTVVIRLARPTYRPGWKQQVIDYIEARREAIFADLAAEFAKPPITPLTATRWATWEREVLGRIAGLENCLRVIAERSKAIDADAAEAGCVVATFREKLSEQGHDPDVDTVFIKEVDASKWLRVATQKARTTAEAATRLVALGIPELVRVTGRGPGWRWCPGTTTLAPAAPAAEVTTTLGPVGPVSTPPVPAEPVPPMPLQNALGARISVEVRLDVLPLQGTGDRGCVG